MTKHGFTLVELSIVLVIIGLLIGGILVGQSLIESAKINAQVQQFQQFDAATMGFKSKYKYLPGDAPAFGGNGDGIISTGNGVSNYVDVAGGETASFWNNIDSNKYASCTASCRTKGQQAIATGSSRNVPAVKLGKNGSFLTISAMHRTNSSFTDVGNPNFYAILDSSQLQTASSTNYIYTITTSANSPLTVPSMLALDQKMDDGVGNTGSVYSGRMLACGSAGGACIHPTALTTCSDNTTGKYDLTQTGYECTPVVRLGSTAGNPL